MSLLLLSSRGVYAPRKAKQGIDRSNNDKTCIFI